MVSEVLKNVGDARLIKQKSNTFGTQKNNELESEFLKAVNAPELRFIEGYNPNLEPKTDAYCVLDLMEDLMSSSVNKWYPNHEAFSYKRIGRNAIEKPKVSNAEKDEMKQLISEGKFDELKKKTEEVSNKEDALKFNYENKAAGHSISNLVWNEKRANLSVQVRYPGHVNLPENEFDTLPEKFDTQIFRNYNLIKDGIIHTYKLPVSLGYETFLKLQENDLLKGEIYDLTDKIFILDFSEIPVINRQMIETTSAEKLFRNEYELLTMKAKNSIFNYYKKQHIGQKSVDFVEKYGVEAAEWLKTLGIASYGFNPPSTLEKSEEEIFVNSLKVKINKLTLISTKKDIDKVLAKYKAGDELTDRENLLIPAIEEFESFMKNMEGIDDLTIVEKWLDKKSEIFRKRKNELMSEISKSKFLCIIGKSWFKEFESREENEMTLKIDDKEIQFLVEDKMEKIKI